MADQKNDKRLGCDTKEGRVWPALDLMGRTYQRPPAATMGIGGGYFVVLPGSVKPAQYEKALEDVKAFVAKPVGATKAKEPEKDE
jgi:hypothetical protein